MKYPFNILYFVGSLVCAISTFAGSSTYGMADTVATEQAKVGGTKEFEDEKARDGKFYWDAHTRLRHEFWNNQEDLNDDLDDLYSFTRLKLFLGGGFRPTKNTEIYVRLINESRFYGHKGNNDSIRTDHLFRPDYGYFNIVIGQLYFKWKNIANDHLDITLGRQNLHNQGFGDQWLIGDGTPLDGSKTFYYNAFRLTYRFSQFSSIDLVGLASFADDPIDLYNYRGKTITNITDEQGGWIWYKNRFSLRFPFHAYYIFKHENGGGGFQRQEPSSIHTLGIQVKPENDFLWLNAQIAGQLGDYGQVSRTGFGTIIYGGYQYQKKDWSIKAGPWYMYLSGDDPSTERFEAFNNLFGGYPNDDELYLNTWMRESGTSMWTNINLIGAYLELMPTPKYNIRFWYHLMQANHPVPGDFFGTDTNRGHMIMLKAMGKFGKRFSAYYMFEYLWTGDFYFKAADNAILSRINLEWNF
jgi:hypothetical protein